MNGYYVNSASAIPAGTDPPFPIQKAFLALPPIDPSPWSPDKTGLKIHQSAGLHASGQEQFAALHARALPDLVDARPRLSPRCVRGGCHQL